MNNYIKIKAVGMLTAVVIAAFSCTNAMDDYYQGGEPTIGEGTVMEYLESVPEYSRLVALIDETGQRDLFAGNTLVTVWAPTDDKMPAGVEAMNLDDKAFLVKNLVSVTTIFSRNLERLKTVSTVAGKTFDVTSSGGTYTVRGYALTELDHAFSNGVVHRVAEWLVPLKNIGQIIEDMGDEYSMFRDTINRHYVKIFDRDNSKIAGVDDKGQIYYDSVFIVKNDLLKDIDIYDETINYTFVAPTNAAFNAMYEYKKNYLESLGRTATAADTLKWFDWMIKASFFKGLINLSSTTSVPSIHGNEFRPAYNASAGGANLSNGKVYLLSKCYVPVSVDMETYSFNPYHLRKEIVASGQSLDKNPGTYDSYWNKVTLNFCLLDDTKKSLFWQVAGNTDKDQYYQFKSCKWNPETGKNTPLIVAPGAYRIKCRLISQKANNNDNLTDQLDFYRVTGSDPKNPVLTLIANVKGITSNKYDMEGGAEIIDEYEVADEPQQLELRVVIPGANADGFRRRICIGEVTLIPSVNNY